MNIKDMIIDQEDIEDEREMKDIEVQQELKQIMITEIRNMSPTEEEDIDQEAEEEEGEQEDREEDEGSAGRKEHKVNLHLLRRKDWLGQGPTPNHSLSQKMYGRWKMYIARLEKQ